MSISEVFQQYSEQANDVYVEANSHHDGHTDYHSGDEHHDWHTDCG